MKAHSAEKIENGAKIVFAYLSKCSSFHVEKKILAKLCKVGLHYYLGS